ncbi:MAG: hypothetical protein PHC62_00065 [Candidatus Izemoplasmatales bacterium]|nr:hypothetical protein [Candidatus Izemoplasmatales bacterium]
MFKSLEQAKGRKKPIGAATKINIANNIKINVDKIKSIDFDAQSDEDLVKLCLESYDKILSHTFDDEYASFRMMTNTKFVIAFSQAMYSVELNDRQRKQICNVIFSIRAKQDPTISDMQRMLLFNLGKIVNKREVPGLMNLGFTEDLSGLLLIAAHSSFNAFKQVKRINRVLLTVQQEVSVESIIKLYEKLGYFSHFTDLFEGIMYDKMDKSKLTDIQKEIYGNIEIALLDIMEELPSNLCYTLLLNFTDMVNMREKMDVRFNIHSINSTDYPRINIAIGQVEQNGKVIPF